MSESSTAEALRETLISPNVADLGEPANVVDAIAAIAYALNRVAKAIEDANDLGRFEDTNERPGLRTRGVDLSQVRPPGEGE